MSEMPPRTYLWQLADFNFADSSLLWEDTNEFPNDQREEMAQMNTFPIQDQVLNISFDQSGPSETEYEI